MAAGAHSRAYKRLGQDRRPDRRDGAAADFKFSADVEEDWDWVVVEARDVTTDPDSDAWTTLPEADTDGAGNADVSLTTTEHGRQLPEGLATDADAPHPFLLHYWTRDCEPTGTTGEWNAFTGSSGGWTDWTVDLSAYAGKKVELRISVITDWGTLGLGAWVDDWQLDGRRDDARVQRLRAAARTAVAVGRRPRAPTTRPTAGRSASQEFTEGGVVATDDTVYTGFGFEGLNESARAGVHPPHADAPRRLKAGAAAAARRPATRRPPRAAAGGDDGQEGPGVREDQGRQAGSALDRKGRVAVRDPRARATPAPTRRASCGSCAARHAVRRQALQRPRGQDQDGQGEAAQKSRAQGAAEAARRCGRLGHRARAPDASGAEHRGASGGPAKRGRTATEQLDGPPPGGRSSSAPVAIESGKSYCPLS